MRALCGAGLNANWEVSLIRLASRACIVPVNKWMIRADVECIGGRHRRDVLVQILAADLLRGLSNRVTPAGRGRGRSDRPSDLRSQLREGSAHRRPRGIEAMVSLRQPSDQLAMLPEDLFDMTVKALRIGPRSQPGPQVVDVRRQRQIELCRFGFQLTSQFGRQGHVGRLNIAHTVIIRFIDAETNPIPTQLSQAAWRRCRRPRGSRRALR